MEAKLFKSGDGCVSVREDDSNSVVDKGTPEKKCESCLDSFELERLFKCTSCNDTSEAVNFVPLICEGCIISHIRKSHDILDHKSLKPAICVTHKNLCSTYCTKCEEILCLNCISKHPNHNIIDLKLRASQVRLQVFEMIYYLDSCEKFARGTQDRLNKEKEGRANGYENLVGEVSAAIDEFKKNVLEKIRVEYEKLLIVQQDSTSNYQLLLKCQSDLRELLSCSEGKMVASFEENEKQFLKMKTKEAELKMVEIQGLNYSVSAQTAPSLLNFSNSFLKFITMPSIVAENDDCFVYSAEIGELYCIKYEEKEITVYKCEFEDHKDGVRISKIQLAAYESEHTISSLQGFALVKSKQHNFGSSQKPTILIKTSIGSVIFEVQNKTFRKIELNLTPQKIPLFFTALNNNEAEFVYWDEKEKLVKQTNKFKIQVKCEFPPRLVNSCRDDTLVHIVTKDKDILELETNQNSRAVVSTTTIPLSIHRVNDISSISFCRGFLLVWSLSAETITWLRGTKGQNDYSLIHCVRFGSCVNYFGIKSREWLAHQFLVSAKTRRENGQWVGTNVFMIKNKLNQMDGY